MGYLLRIPVALVGLLLIRGYLYPRGWGRRRLPGALFAVIGVALTVPLASYSRAGLFITLGGAALALFPYRSLAVRFMKSRTRAALDAVADRWATEVSEDEASGRWEVVRPSGDGAMWVGNVLTHKGSIDPTVRRKETGYMLALVIELRHEPAFQCSLMVGWDKPRYFEREWRATHVIQGEFLSLPFGDIGLASDRGRSTGGSIDALAPYEDVDLDLPRRFSFVGTRPAEFSRAFDSDLRAALRKVASQTYPFELNVTPSSVNIYTTYCGPEVLLADLEFLERLADRLDSDR